MTEKQEKIYANRDTMLGRIDERTKIMALAIPIIQKDISSLKKKQAVLEVKAGIFGTLGGMFAMFLYYLKDLIIYGRNH